jgi:fimbrial chaperone protein
LPHIEGYVSKKNVLRWLANYESLVAGDRPYDALPSNSGPKNVDGVSGGRVNKIMLDQALDKLRQEMPFSWNCLLVTYIRPILQKEALRILRVRRSVYIRGLGEGVEFIYREINGGAAEEKDMLEGMLEGLGYGGYKRLSELVFK